MAIPEVTTPPGLLMYMWIGFFVDWMREGNEKVNVQDFETFKIAEWKRFKILEN